MRNNLLKEIEATGISEEQAVKALSIVAKFATERFPILEGSIKTYLKTEFRNIKYGLKDGEYDEL